MRATRMISFAEMGLRTGLWAELDNKNGRAQQAIGAPLCGLHKEKNGADQVSNEAGLHLWSAGGLVL